MEKAANGAEGRHFPGEGKVELRGNRGEQSTTIVKKNQGSHGVDGMQVGTLLAYLRLHGETIGQKILNGEYKPQPVRRVEIPKPDGGIRLLGSPRPRGSADSGR